MRDLLGTIAFFSGAMGTFRLVYGSWPPNEGQLLSWLSSDSKARWALGVSLVGGMVATLIIRSLSSTKSRRESDARIAQAKEYARQGLAHHNDRRQAEAAAMFTRAIDLYREASRTVDAAPVYASLGKLHFDFNELDLAEKNLQEALRLFEEWPRAHEEIKTASLLLDMVWAKRRLNQVANRYVDPVYGFSLLIPADSGPQKLVSEFANSGGRAAFSHKTNAATLNVSVGVLVERELRLPEVRVVSAREHLLKNSPNRVSGVTAQVSVPVGGETNVITAEYDTRNLIGQEYRQRRNGFVSAVHEGDEYVIQWSAETVHEPETREIVKSLSFRSPHG